MCKSTNMKGSLLNLPAQVHAYRYSAPLNYLKLDCLRFNKDNTITLFIILFPQISVSSLSRHVKCSERNQKRRRQSYHKTHHRYNKPSIGGGILTGSQGPHHMDTTKEHKGKRQAKAYQEADLKLQIYFGPV